MPPWLSGPARTLAAPSAHGTPACFTSATGSPCQRRRAPALPHLACHRQTVITATITTRLPLALEGSLVHAQKAAFWSLTDHLLQL